MRHLKKEEAPIFLFYGFCHLTAWITSLSLLYHAVIKGLPLNEVGYDKPCILAAALVAMVIMAWRFPFLRPLPLPKGKRLLWRSFQVVFGCLAMICFGPFLMSVILMDAEPIFMFNTALGSVCFLLCAWLIGRFVIPTLK